MATSNAYASFFKKTSTLRVVNVIGYVFLVVWFAVQPNIQPESKDIPSVSRKYDTPITPAG